MRNDGLKRAGDARAPVLGQDVGVLGWLADWLASLSRERKIRRQIQELRHLSDRELRDIGLNRADVVHAVRFGRFAGTRDE